MTIRTPEQYLQSLRDNRVVYCEGERVKDVTKHPIVGLCARAGALDYLMAHDKTYRDTFVTHDEKGEEYSFVFHPARKAEDLMRLREIVQVLARIRYGEGGGSKFTGVDALHAVAIASRRVDKAIGTHYADRVERFREYMKKNDTAVIACVSDVKGDRSLRPSKQMPHQDYYVHIVDESKDGIWVSGAKMHISFASCVNEMIVIPCRAMGEQDKDYAVCFAVPVNTKGITIITSQEAPFEPENYFDFPINASIFSASGCVVFDNVFVPMERVFLKREWQFSSYYPHLFADFHRLTADAYKYPELEVLVGLGAILAEYNGLENVPHVREKLSRLMIYAEGVEALGKAAAVYCENEPNTDLVYPNPMYSNVAKFYFADNFHQAVKMVQDIGGGLVSGGISSRDFFNPETRPLLEKYFSGKAGIATEFRLRAMRLVRDLCNEWHLAVTVHGEGSLATQLLAVNALGDWDKYKAAAKRAARIDDGTEHLLFKGLPDFPLSFE